MKAKSLDDMLSGGFEPGIITEIYGEAGTGKTNICLQLGREIAASGKKVAYLDTEGVSMERLEQICGEKFEVVMRNFLVYKPLSLDEQGKNIRGLKRIPELGLVVVDTVNIYTRMGSSKDPEVDRTFLGQIIQLQRFARETMVPVVVTAQVYGSNDDVHPFSGRTMAHIAKTIIRLEKIGIGLRKAVLIKHRSVPEAKEAEFRLTGKGVE